jgi:hypothetical protein
MGISSLAAGGEESLVEVTTICRVEGRIGRASGRSPSGSGTQEGPGRLEKWVGMAVGSVLTVGWSGGNARTGARGCLSAATTVVGGGDAGACSISVSAVFKRRVMAVVACAILGGIASSGALSMSVVVVWNREVGARSSSRSMTINVERGIAGTGVVAGEVGAGVGTDVGTVVLGR